MLNLFVFAVPLLLFTIFLIKWFSTTNEHNHLPPSPPRLPILGNLHQLGKRPHRSLQQLAQHHGELIMLHFGSRPVLIVSSADAAREIMKTNDLIFSNKPKLTIIDRLLYEGKDVSTAPYGEVAFGRKYSGGEGAMKFKKLLGEFMEVLGGFCVGDFIPWLSWVSRFSGLDARVEKVFKEFDGFLDTVLEDHMVNLSTKGDICGIEGEDRKDFVDVLLEVQKNNITGSSIDRDGIKAVILDMFAGGTDTTSTVLEWAMTELIRHPRVMKRLQNEVMGIANGKQDITESDLDKMPYLKAVIKETLRLYPPIPLLSIRESTQDVKVKGYDIAARTMVLVNAWTIGRDPSLWDEPEEFQPDRFMNSSVDFKGQDFQLIPFGAGRRGCPGILFAITTNELVLANLVHKFEWALPSGATAEDMNMTECNGVVIHKEVPLIVMAAPRSS
ncbi:putative psoralen synthase [Rosa chinensis]|uniref:Putative psoralen synthase n=1 Tax=Rosa chinensis TaxID=74649 RepID=A0A2P6P5I3_ROSCH|nr:putative psoralen synthase [Rosa chinensis]